MGRGLHLHAHDVLVRPLHAPCSLAVSCCSLLKLTNFRRLFHCGALVRKSQWPCSFYLTSSRLPVAQCRSAAVHAFIADWGDDMLGPLAEVFVSNSNNEDNRGGDFTSSNTVPRELALLWPCLSHIRDSLKDIENSRTKVVLARQAAADTSNNESIASAVIKVRSRWRYDWVWRSAA